MMPLLLDAMILFVFGIQHTELTNNADELSSCSFYVDIVSGNRKKRFIYIYTCILES
jgi:hypothetical protein